MPVDYELFFTGSPPLFRHSLNPIADFRFCNNVCNRLAGKMPMSIPLRPILIVRHPDGEIPSPDALQTPVSSPTSKSKKRVVFADDKGLALAHVKIMTEPSDCPPLWQDEFVEKVTGCASSGPPAPDKWEPMFPQPASDYVQFRQKLDSSYVSLENVIVKDGEETVLGTVKVKNLAFEKKVIVRSTQDAWNNHDDVEATYVPTGIEGTAVYDIYDTFSFSIKLPSASSTSQCIEFCLCFRCGDKEYWDNNNGANYKLVSTPAVPNPPSPPPTQPFGNPFLDARGILMFKPVENAYNVKMDNWTEFASWQHLLNDSPYW